MANTYTRTLAETTAATSLIPKAVGVLALRKEYGLGLERVLGSECKISDGAPLCINDGRRARRLVSN